MKGTETHVICCISNLLILDPVEKDRSPHLALEYVSDHMHQENMEVASVMSHATF